VYIINLFKTYKLFIINYIKIFFYNCSACDLGGCMGVKMLTKTKRVQGAFLAFLITFTYSSFPLSWGGIGEKTCSYSVKSFNGIEKIFNTRVGEYLGSLMCFFVMCMIARKIFGKSAEKETVKKETECVRNEEKRKLTFEDDYFGVIPSKILARIKECENKQLYIDCGINMRKGMLIVGRPGVGKTYLMKIFADETGATLYLLDGVRARGGRTRGSGGELIRKTFSSAREHKGNAIVLIDEIDAMCNAQLSTGEDVEGLKTLQIELDGPSNSSNQPMVVGITNCPNKMCSALHRRFELIKIDLPSEEVRESFLQSCVEQHMKPAKIQECCDLESIYYAELAMLTNGFSQDKLSSMVNSVFKRAVAQMVIENHDSDHASKSVDVRKEKIVIRHKEFKSEIQSLNNQSNIARTNFLKNRNYELAGS